MWTTDDVYLCPAGERLVYRYTNQERGLNLAPLLEQLPARAAPSRTAAPRARNAASPAGSTNTSLRPCSRRLDEQPEKMRQRRETVEHPFGTIIGLDGLSTHFQMKTLKRVGTEMALARAGLQSQTRHEASWASGRCSKPSAQHRRSSASIYAPIRLNRRPEP